MMSIFVGKKGFSMIHLLVAISVCVVLAGITMYGIQFARRQAEITSTASKVSNVAQAVQVYFQQHGEYPMDCPANLEHDLSGLVTNLNLSQMSAAVNAGYCRPMVNDPASYVFSLVVPNTPQFTCASFGDGLVEICRSTNVMYNGSTMARGTVITTGRIDFETGSSIVPFNNTPIMLVAAFVTDDGSPYEVAKISATGAQYLVDVMSANKSIVELATVHAQTLARDGGMRVYAAYTALEKVQIVGAVYGEIIVSFPPFSKGLLGSVTAGDLGGEPLEMSPGGSEDFQFYLQKPDGEEITRDMLLANRDLEYQGPAQVVRFRLNNAATQDSSLILNGVPYPLEKFKVYTIRGTDLSLRLYNDKKGKGMGLWRIDNIAATNAVIYEGIEPPEGSEVAGYTLGAVILIKEPVIGKPTRTLGSRGYRVMPNTFVYSSADAQ